VSFLRKLFGSGSDEAGAPSSTSGGAADDAEWLVASEAAFDASAERHRVTIWLRLFDPTFETTREQIKVFAIENEVISALEGAGVGEHDTNSLEKDYMAIRLIGDDADAIAAIVMPLLDDAAEGSYLAVRRGPRRTAEDRVEIGRGASGTEAV
jgi:hypothetical protein